MLFSFLKNKTVLSKNGKKIGRIKAADIDYGTGKICGLVIGSVFNFNKQFIPAKNLIINDDLIYSEETENFIEKNDKGDLIGFRVYTENGNYLGKVGDFDINIFLWRLSLIFASQRIGSKKSLIIEDNQIVKINKGKIIVKDLSIEEAVPNLA